jgi:hypothetical protein
MEMALRSKAQIGALLILGFSGLSTAAEPVEVPVRHRHWRHGTEGTLHVGDDTIVFEEAGKHRDHSRRWQFDDIEQLTLRPDSLRILTYEDRRWQLGRDREFVFDHLPENLAARLYSRLSGQLDQRFVAAVQDQDVVPLWQLPAKLLGWAGGSQGTLLVGREHVAFRTDSPGRSRTWRIRDIDAISSSGPFDLTVTTFERSGASYAGHKDFHFALKRPLAESEYDRLWRDVNQSKGLQILNSSIRQDKNSFQH